MKKNLAQIGLIVFENNAPLIAKNDVTELKIRRLGYSTVKKLVTGKKQFQASCMTKSNS